MLECLLNLPDIDNTASHPLDFQALALAQAQDAGLQCKQQTDPTHYVRRLFDTGVYLLVFVSPAVARWRICIPSARLDQMIQWYHLVLNHVGIG